ncbi:MAG: C10 family peptidase, partial [Oscillospiraceae bacterium]|nr:C10 family peptidase [Oscillospiraceae bacterium]
MDTVKFKLTKKNSITMKKFLLIMALGLFISSCSNDEPVHQDCNEAESEVVLRSVEEAVELAEKLNEVRFANMTTRSQEKNVKGVEIISSLNSRSGSDTLIYAINYDGNGGFTLVSAAKRGIAIIGYADEGNFDEDSAKENPNFSYYLNEAKEYVTTQLSIGGPIVDPSFPEISMQAIFVKYDLKWGQRYPEGIYCPNGIAGCAQTAMAIIMGNMAAPSSINLTYPDHDIDNVTFDWAEIRKHTKSSTSESHLSSCEVSEGIHKNIGRLCRELGYRNNASYGE